VRLYVAEHVKSPRVAARERFLRGITYFDLGFRLNAAQIPKLVARPKIANKATKEALIGVNGYTNENITP